MNSSCRVRTYVHVLSKKIEKKKKTERGCRKKKKRSETRTRYWFHWRARCGLRIILHTVKIVRFSRCRHISREKKKEKRPAGSFFANRSVSDRDTVALFRQDSYSLSRFFFLFHFISIPTDLKVTLEKKKKMKSIGESDACTRFRPIKHTARFATSKNARFVGREIKSRDTPHDQLVVPSGREARVKNKYTHRNTSFSPLDQIEMEKKRSGDQREEEQVKKKKKKKKTKIQKEENNLQSTRILHSFPVISSFLFFLHLHFHRSSPRHNTSTQRYNLPHHSSFI